MPLRLKITKVTDGFGVGTGTISGTAPEALSGNEDLGVLTDKAIHDPRILVPIGIDKRTGSPLTDDGCGDGRSVSKRAGAIFTGTSDKLQTFAHSLNRAKVFGGGATMTVAMRIGLGLSARQTLNDAFRDAMRDLDHHRMGYGAHTDDGDHAHDGKCGCGAIDKAPAIIAAVRDNQDHIAHSIATLGVDVTGLHAGAHGPGVLDNFVTAADQDNTSYAGKNIMNEIAASGRIVKELHGDHRETRIILNFVEDYTVDQGFVRKHTNDRAQVFAVDVWRLTQLARLLYGEPTGNVETEAEHRAFLSELIYTLGTALVLTDGTLPVYIIHNTIV